MVPTIEVYLEMMAWKIDAGELLFSMEALGKIPASSLFPELIGGGFWHRL